MDWVQKARLQAREICCPRGICYAERNGLACRAEGPPEYLAQLLQYPNIDALRKAVEDTPDAGN